ncbi:MAG: nitroreductase family deazaflavin-dependent oxidoreductase [Acidimicrobiales bacterium]
MTDFNDWNKQIMAEFRENAGKVGGPFEGAPMLILHTTGAKSGAERETPLMYQALDGGSIAIFASMAGAPTNPAWYHNIVANPAVTVELGTETKAFTARVATPEEREPIWTKQKADYANFAEYETLTTRTIPVVILDPA